MPRPSLEIEDLFDAAFLESLQRLRILARRVARGGRPAEQRSKDMGAGIEFRDFRPYSPGDDFRTIDWNIYRRLGRVFVRLFEELEDLPVYLLPDISESMYMEEPPRARAGLRAALGLACIALNQHDSVGLFPFGADLEIALRPQSGKGRWLRFAAKMAGFEPGGPTDFRGALRRFSAVDLRAGLVIIVSDFFDPGGAEAVIESLQRIRHRLLLVQLVRGTDRDPELEGDLQLVDCESGARETVSATPAVLARYRQAYDRFQEQLLEFARRRHAGFLRIDADAEIVPQLATLFETGSYVA